eukprot:scaffold259653_cov44-Attheya_sp.AAC.1
MPRSAMIHHAQFLLHSAMLEPGGKFLALRKADIRVASSHASAKVHVLTTPPPMGCVMNIAPPRFSTC